MNLGDISGKLVTLSEKAGASQAEAFVTIVKTAGVYIDDDMPKIGSFQTEIGAGLKYIIGKKLGFTSSTLATESVQDVVDRAMSIAKVSSEDPKFVSLPDPKKASGSPDMFFDADTANVDTEYLIGKTMELVDSAKSNIVTVPNGSLRASSVEFHVQNSLGVDAGSKSTIVFGFFTAKSEDSGKVGEGVQRCWSRNIDDIDFTKIGEKLQSQAIQVLKAETFKDKWEDVIAILAPSEGSEILGTLVGSAANAENVNTGSSAWADNLGASVANKALTVSDNGRSEKGLMSAIVDDEGTPTQNTTLIENGILQSYYFDSYSALQRDVVSTGNGYRRNDRETNGRFGLTAGCRSSCLEVAPGTKSLDDMIGEIDKGIYIEHFAWPIVDPMSGAFSNEVRNAQLIEKGELTKQVKYLLWVGNLLESIKGEIMIGANPEVHSRRIMPVMAFPGTEIVGQ
ncbi:MAG: TldD/PmbA family protein [Candidatus Thorarchaeota archaeon]